MIIVITEVGEKVQFPYANDVSCSNNIVTIRGDEGIEGQFYASHLIGVYRSEATEIKIERTEDNGNSTNRSK